MYKKIEASKAQFLLGKKIESYRKYQGLGRAQLGKIVNETEQQIGRFEAGSFVPIATLDRIAKALDNRIEKRTLRRIQKYRDIELHEKADQPELLGFYEEAFPELPEFF